MSDMRIRRTRSFSVPQYQPVGKTEKQSGTSGTKAAGAKAALDTLEQGLLKMGMEPSQQARQALRNNESLLAEVEDLLKGMEDLAQKAQEEGADTESLQAQLEQLKGELQRVLDAGAFSSDGPLDMDALLNVLGLDSSATGPQIADAIGKLIAQMEGALPSEQTAEMLPGLQDLMAMPSLSALMAVLGGGGGFDLLMGLMEMLEGSGQLGLLDALVPSESAAPSDQAPAELTPQELPQPEAARAESAPPAPQSPAPAPDAPPAPQPGAAAPEPVPLAMQEQAPSPALVLADGKPVVLQQARVPQAVAQSPQARVVVEGETQIAQLEIKENSTLTVTGGGMLHIGVLKGDATGSLRLESGAVVIEEQPENAAPIVLDGPASLIAARGATVVNAQGEPLSPADVLWKALVPDMAVLTALTVDGKQGPLSLTKGVQQEVLRLWLRKGDDSQGFPGHSVVLQGRDKAGKLQTRYAFLRWNQQTGGFESVPQYPNPFTVTGGQPDADWRYEEESGTLTILTGQVSALSGGPGEDANQEPFSGRIALSDGIGSLKLRLEGVECRVPSGRAFGLGRGNRVTLLLQPGSQNTFESGPGCAGISLGEGTSLLIDQAPGPGSPGELTALGNPGMGRDSGVGRQLSGSILIRGGVVRASGNKEAPPLPKTPAPRFTASSQSLHLDALDIRTREAAQSALDVLARDRRQVSRLQKACSTLYSRLEEGPGLRDSLEAGSLLGGMREQLENSSLAAYSQWLLDDVGPLLW